MILELTDVPECFPGKERSCVGRSLGMIEPSASSVFCCAIPKGATIPSGMCVACVGSRGRSQLLVMSGTISLERVVS